MGENPLLRRLSEATYRARAQAVMERVRETGALDPIPVAKLGWRAGGGKGWPPGDVYALPVEQHGADLLESIYFRAYFLALREQPDTRVRRITKRGLEDYAQSLRRPAYALWAGAISLAEFVSTFTDAMARGLGRAWREGAAEFGIAPAELTQAERMELELAIGKNLPFINKLGSEILQKPRGVGKWGPFKDRINRTWSNRYNELYNQGMLMAGKNQKLMWTLHKKRFTKEPCTDCLMLNGKVYRRETWLKHEVYPQSPNLKCGGYNCGCGWTAVPGAQMNKGRPPKLHGQRA